MTAESVMRVVTLQGGPLDGKKRHVARGETRVKFMDELSTRKSWYRRHELWPAVWVYEKEAQ